AGYKVYYGLNSGNYTDSRDVGNVLTAIVSGLADETTYYLAAIAYNANGEESLFSNEILFDNVAPTINGPAEWAVTAGAGGTADAPDLTGEITVSDDISSAANLVLTQTPLPGTTLPEGETIVTVTAEDEAGNRRSHSVALTVRPMPKPNPPRNLRLRRL
ncbi:MAG: HYR domain-containing protein, partial [Phycisphaerae bacterium]|nr:HYR domain-containing protein [Phycisphaerae bacterium]